MFVKLITNQIRNDFWYTGECEHCGHEQKRMSGYDDENYYERVIPSIHCPQCGRNRAGDKKMEPLEQQIARACHEANRGLCIAQGDYSQVEWHKAPQWQRDSAVNGVMFCIANPDAPPSANHDNWLKVKTEDGWKYGPVKDEMKKEHPCFVPYEALPPEQKVKDHVFKSIVAALAPKVEKVSSESDARTVNNDVRHAYRVLSDDEKKAMVEIKDAGQAFLDLMTSHFGRTPDGRYSSRELSLAQTNLEQAVMWAVKHVTR